MDTTGKALIDFWKKCEADGSVKKASAANFRNAAFQVLSVQDGWEKLDMKHLTADEAIRRFQNKRATEFKADSLKAYANRFNVAVSEFLRWSENPAAWKASFHTRSSRSAAATGKTKTPTKPITGAPDPTPSNTVPTVTTVPGVIEYPCPLADGRFAYLRLPVDLKAADVKKLVGLLNALTSEG